MTMKSIEIYYNIVDIPDITDRSDFSPEALPFRNAAMEHIENAMTAVNAGEWVGAEIGSGEVNFGFDVEDFDTAEAVVRTAVAGTPYDCIREITRNEFSEEDMIAAEQAAAAQPTIKPMTKFETISMLLFRRMPKRFRQ